jgi:hypothetical protein
LTSHQPFRSAVAFLALAAHNAEEALYGPGWVLANREWLTQYIRPGLPEIWVGSAFRLALLCLTLVLLVIAAWAARAVRRSPAVYLLLAVLAVFAANAVFPHIVGAVALRAYVPGAATAIALVLPVAIWICISTLREDYATRRGTFMAATIGIALYATVASLAFGL